MGCQDVRRVIYFFLDESLGENKYRDMAKHFSLCPECDERRKIHQRLRDFIRRRFSRDAATERLKTRLTRSLRAVRIGF